jgi:hypothetical protein
MNGEALNMPKRTESPETTIFDSFVQTTWAEYQKMLDAHERAAWLEGYKCAKNEVLQEIVRNYGKADPD